MKRIIHEIERFRREHGYQPTVRELSDLTGIPVATLHSRLETLRSEGKVDWEPRQLRTLHVLEGALK